MNGRTLGGFIAFALFLAAGPIVKAGKESGSTLIPLLGVGLAVGLIFCVHKGYNPVRKLWVGPTYEAMKKEASELEELLWNTPSEIERQISPKEREKLMKREEKLLRMMKEYRQLNEENT